MVATTVRTLENFIGGDWAEATGDDARQIVSPVTGETLAEVPDASEEVGARVDRLIAEARSAPGDVLLFAHGHLLRVLTARWLGLEPTKGRLFALDPATLSILGYERETSVIRLWN